MQPKGHKLGHGRCPYFSPKNDGQRLRAGHKPGLYQPDKGRNNGTAALNNHGGKRSGKHPVQTVAGYLRYQPSHPCTRRLFQTAAHQPDAIEKKRQTTGKQNSYGGWRKCFIHCRLSLSSLLNFTYDLKSLLFFFF